MVNIDSQEIEVPGLAISEKLLLSPTAENGGTCRSVEGLLMPSSIAPYHAPHDPAIHGGGGWTQFQPQLYTSVSLATAPQGGRRRKGDGQEVLLGGGQGAAIGTVHLFALAVGDQLVCVE
jgi:hypothetical protein